MSNYVFTPNWGNTWIGATEKYITADISPTAAEAQFTDLMRLRAALLPTTSYFVGWRVGINGGQRSSTLVRAPLDTFWPTGSIINIASRGSSSPTNANGWPPLMQHSVQLNVRFAGVRLARKFLSGVPQNVVGGQPATLTLANNTNWSKGLSDLFDFLTNNSYQIAAQNTPTGGNYSVTNIAPATTSGGNIGLGLSGVAPGAITAGQTIMTQHFLPAKGTRAPTINGHWTVDSVNTSSPTSAVVFLRNSGAVDPAEVRISQKSIVFVKNISLFTIQGLNANLLITHKRGKAGGSLRGRRLTRPSLDP